MSLPVRRFHRRKAISLATGLVVLGACALTVVLPSGTAYAADTATINGATTYQTIAGFGASEAFGQASAVMNASSSVQQQVLADLYSPTTGAGLTILRNEIGADNGNSIEPNNPGGPNAAPNYLSLSQTNQDQGQLWFAQQIKPLRRHQHLRRRVERPGVHEDQRLRGQRRPGLRLRRERPAPAATGARRTRTTWCSTPRTTPPPGCR